MTLHYVVRKLRIEEIARECFLEGYCQLVVLGAGFDTLTQRLAEDPQMHGLTLIELDHPSTQSAKVDVLRLYGLLSDRVEHLPCEIGVDDLSATLARSKRFSPDARTLFIAEGLLMYLHPDEVQDLIASVYRLTPEGGRFAFTFMEMLQGGRIAFRKQSWIADWWLQWRGEPFKWGIAKDWMAPFLEHRGFDLLELTDAEDFRRLYLTSAELSGLPLADGDHLVVAQRKERAACPVQLREPDVSASYSAAETAPA
jgi:methyltransferase (TIGR00027 family)